MRILLDECVPAKLARALPEHDVTTVQRMRRSGVADATLLQEAASLFDAFITVDRSMQHQLVPPSNLIFILLHVPDNSVRSVTSLAPEILDALRTKQTGEVVHIGSWPH